MQNWTPAELISNWQKITSYFTLLYRSWNLDRKEQNNYCMQMKAEIHWLPLERTSIVPHLFILQLSIRIILSIYLFIHSSIYLFIWFSDLQKNSGQFTLLNNKTIKPCMSERFSSAIQKYSVEALLPPIPGPIPMLIQV